MKQILQIETITAADLFAKIDELKAAPAPANEADVIAKYWPEVSLKDAAILLECSTSTVRKICLEHPEKLSPSRSGKYPVHKIFAVKKMGWKNLRP